MTKAELLAKLKAIREQSDREAAHADADDALLDYINDAEVRAAYDAIEKWYA